MSVEDLRSRIADEAIKWADECALEHSKDERKPKYESAFRHRVNQQQCLQKIKLLVNQLHEIEGNPNYA